MSVKSDTNKKKADKIYIQWVPFFVIIYPQYNPINNDSLKVSWLIKCL